jgi:hypothetical protein
MASSTKPTPNNDITVTQAVPVLGGAGAPSTPPSGQAAFYGRGTSNLTPGFKNEGGTDTVIMTSIGSSGTVMEHGWGFIAGNSSGSNATKAVTFTTAFTSITNLIIGNIGYLSGSDPAAIGDFNAGENADIVHRGAYSITTSGFTAFIEPENGRSLAASTIRYGFSYIAFGTKN